jgi:hypothetical protein
MFQEEPANCSRNRRKADQTKNQPEDGAADLYGEDQRDNYDPGD